ncbi:NAD(P)/FAD-dependent oxidoreductase [bacterium]|nr:NAD(P)/FAD-dependent oxidoreductase [bacterium]
MPFQERADVVIMGGGPAGLQAALVISRTRKKVVVFDSPQAPRNAVSHGVHNFLGLDGLLPAEIREVAWKQIEVYQSAELRNERVTDVRRNPEGRFMITGANGTQLEAAKVVLAVGYHDVYPDIAGFVECWGDTIIPCPFCDGFENRGRAWGIVPSSELELSRFPKLAQNWTTQIKVFLPAELEIEPNYRDELERLGIPIHEGSITEIHHTRGKVDAVTLNSGERVDAETLLWVPAEEPSPLIQNMVENLGLELDEMGYVKTDEMQQTNVEGLWAAGDVQGWTGGLQAAAAGGIAGHAIVHGWYG